MNASDLFEKLIAIDDPIARNVFLTRIESGNLELGRSLRAALANYSPNDSFLETPAVDQIAQRDGGDDFLKALEARFQEPKRYSDSELTLDFLSPPTAPDTLGNLANYEIHEIIGHGGSGIVLRAKDPNLVKWFAIKVMHRDQVSDAVARKRLMQEARSLGKIDHENIVRIYRVEESPVPFLVMELVEGTSLDRWIDDTGGIELDLFLSIAHQIGRGLTVAHEHGLIHRDVKPANILLTDAHVPVAKLTDFGLARQASDLRLTVAGSIVGTPLYMSPEQIKDDTIDCRSDLFSLGIVYYEMITGQPPFGGSNHFFVMNAIVDEMPVSIGSSGKSIPGSLEEIIQRLLEKDPDQRYQSASEVVEALASVAKPDNAPKGIADFKLASDLLGRSSLPLMSLASLVVTAAIAAILWLPRGSIETIGGPVGIKQGNSSMAQTRIQEQKAAIAVPSSVHPWVTELRIPFDTKVAKDYQERWAKLLGLETEFVNTAGVPMVLIPPGEYLIGFTPDELTRGISLTDSDEVKQLLRSAGTATWVRISFPFYISKYEITEAERFAILKDDHSPPTVLDLEGAIPRRQRGRSAEYSITRIPWEEAMLICRKLNQQEGLPIHPEPIVADDLGLAAYRLPTDAEWEWVARAGRSGCGTMNAESLRAEGWILANSNAQMAPRGQKDPNPFGVYDMIGNAQEWCLDEFDESHFQGNSDANPMVNPLMDAGDSYHRFHHILRGGSVIFKEDFSNYSYRTFRDQHSTSWFTGFRIVLPISGVRQQGHEPTPRSD